MVVLVVLGVVVLVLVFVAAVLLESARPSPLSSGSSSTIMTASSSGASLSGRPRRPRLLFPARSSPVRPSPDVVVAPRVAVPSTDRSLSELSKLSMRGWGRDSMTTDTGGIS